MKRFAVFALFNIVFIRIWIALNSRGMFPYYWINTILFAVLLIMDYFGIRALRISISADEAEFIRRHLFAIIFVTVIFLGATNSLVTIIVGQGRMLDVSNLIVGVILVPLILTILRKSWKQHVFRKRSVRQTPLRP